MINVSSNYKEIMARPIRNRAFISVGIGVVNQNAQSNASVNGNFAYWSYGDIFNQYQSKIDYATLEDNLFKMDGSMLFLPEDNDSMQLKANGIITDDVLDTIQINFNDAYSIKGITIDFGDVYPTKFTIITEEKTLEYDNTSDTFSASDVLGTTTYIEIKPISMIGGRQRFRIKSILMGVGLQFSNKQTKQIKISESNSPISEDLPIENVTYSFYDEENRFDVDDDNSFMDFLETMQKVKISFGVELDDGSVEWNQIATTFLKDWKNQKGVVSLSTTDRLQQMEDEYSLGYKIYTRTAYKEAETILQDAGLQPDEYIIDDYLADVILHNPMPKASHKECLQLLANACRCIIRQDETGKIIVKANFATVLDPDDLTVTTNGTASWSIPQNVVYGDNVVYAELTNNFFKMDGAMYFMPEDENYLETSYVSEQISNEFGDFDANLLPYPYAHTTLTYRGVTFTDNGDGSVSVSGTATGGSSYFQLCGYNESTRSKILNLPHGRYAFDINTTDSENIYIGCDKKLISDCSYIGRYMYNMKSPSSITIPESDIGTYFPAFLICVPNGKTANGICYPMLTKIEEDGSYPTEYQPYQENPKLTISMPASYSYYGVNVIFDGNPPEELIIHTYKNDIRVEDVRFRYLTNTSYLMHEFSSFDKMTFEFTKAKPENRVLVNKISFGALSDYVLTKQNMLEQPIGYKEKKTKAVKVKVFSYQNNEDGDPKEIEDEVYAEKTINTVGEVKTVQNPLVDSKEQAEILAEWIANYYANNVSYDVKYRGEPRINATDIIHMESEKKNNLQVEITKHTLQFDGSFSGELELRRALKLMR